MIAPATFSFDPLDDLYARRHPDNPKDHDLPAIKASIQRSGFRAAVGVNDADGYVVYGHGRIEVLWGMHERGEQPPKGIQVDAAGSWLVPTVHHQMTEDEARAHRISDNRTTELGGWINPKLLEELEFFRNQDLGLDGLGFSDEDLEALIQTLGGSESPVPDPEDAPPSPGPRDVRIRPGDLIALGPHRLICGDARRSGDVARLTGPATVRCCWTDPPFGVAYEGGTTERLTIANDSAAGLAELLRDSFAAVDRFLASGAALYVCHPAGPLSMTFAQAFVDVGWQYRQTLVWVKDSFVLGRSHFHYRHEPILFGYKPGNGRLGRGGVGWHGGERRVVRLRGTTPPSLARPSDREARRSRQSYAQKQHPAWRHRPRPLRGFRLDADRL